MKVKPITREQGDVILKEVLKGYGADFLRSVKKPLTQNQFDALVSFTYNLGGANLGKPTLLKKVNVNPNDTTISAEFVKWNMACGRVLNGLTMRRQEEASLYFNKG